MNSDCAQSAPSCGATPAATTETTGTTAPPPPAEAQANDVLGTFSSLFASEQPKHAWYGLTDGVRNVMTGAGVGVAALLGSTVSGASEGGLWGGLTGFGAGTLGLAGSTAYGVYAGARQVVRGISNTPQAVREVNAGDRLWDGDRREWVTVKLDDDLAALPITDDDILTAARAEYRKQAAEIPALAPEKSVDDADAPKTDQPDYYQLLGVDKKATSGEIKKAFTQKALVMHPDKNPNDPDATRKFQELMNVYNVLSNPATRAEYDAKGFVDPNHVEESETNPLEQVLGSQYLEPLVGRLRFLSFFQRDALFTQAMDTELEHRRRLRVTQNLRRFVESGESGLASFDVVVRDAVSTPVGPALVAMVAEQYALAARQYLRGDAWVRELDSFFSSKMQSVSSAWDYLYTGTTVAGRAARGTLAEADAMKLLVTANATDVRRIALRACRMLLLDTSATAEQREARAQKLVVLSERALAEVQRELTSRAGTPSQLTGTPTDDGTTKEEL